jgi:acetylornithine deacetylase/succinyl-diaminopimelate desuccinylase-like protein
MKSMVAGELAAFIAVKKAKVTLDRDLIFCAFADEEAGGTYGADWVWKNHRDKIDAEFALNEGGGTPLEIGGKRFYTCQAGEKGATRLRLTVRGNPGHASTPVENTSMSKLGLALERLHAWDHPTVMTTTVRMMLDSIATALGGEAQQRIEAVLAQDSPAILPCRR